MIETGRSPTEPAVSRKLLFLTPFAPDLQGSHGGAKACAAIIDMLAMHHRVQLLYLAPDGDDPPRQLPSGCEHVEAIPIATRVRRSRGSLFRTFETIASLWRKPSWVEETFSPLAAQRMAEVTKRFEPDDVHFEFHVMAQYIETVRAAFNGAKCIVTEHEPGIVADSGPSTNLPLRRRIGDALRRSAWKRFEREALRASDAVIMFTQHDAGAIRGLLGSECPDIRIIPLRLPQNLRQARGDAKRNQSDFLFVGNFIHPPNADAARRLVRNIFPLIQREMPEATLTIVGPNPPQDLVDAGSKRITVTGWVEDPSVYLAGASVILVPLRQGGGLRVKMLEACGAGKAIVASSTALQGLSLEHGRNVMAAETDEEFASTAIALTADSEARAQLERASRRWWEDEHNSERWLAQYEELYASLDRRPDATSGPGRRGRPATPGRGSAVTRSR